MIKLHENQTDIVEQRAGKRELDLDTIRRRVARIKRGWSPEMVRARADEGRRRRAELENMFYEYLCDTSDSEETCDLGNAGLSLVG